MYQTRAWSSEGRSRLALVPILYVSQLTTLHRTKFKYNNLISMNIYDTDFSFEQRFSHTVTQWYYDFSQKNRHRQILLLTILLLPVLFLRFKCSMREPKLTAPHLKTNTCQNREQQIRNCVNFLRAAYQLFERA